MASLSAMLGSPLPDSSPPRPPRPNPCPPRDGTSSPTPQGPIPATSSANSSRQPTPSPDEEQPLSRKRAAGDPEEFALGIARSNKLTRRRQDELCTVAKVPLEDQMIWLGGKMLAVEQKLEKVVPDDAPWLIPKTLQKRLEKESARILLDPGLNSYRSNTEGPSAIICRLVMANPEWGLPKALQTDTAATEAVTTAVGRALVIARNGIKAEIQNSLGTDPANGVTLRPGATNIVDLSTAILRRLKLKQTIDARLCGRVAILRAVILEKDDNKYWRIVDEKLKDIRDAYPDATEQSKFIKKKVLDIDMKTYGRVNLASA